MRAALATGHGLRLGEVDPPAPGPGQVLVRPRTVGICGSDLHLIDQLAQLGEDLPPIVPGHEFCAEVVEAGPDGAGPPVGTRVVSVPYAQGPDGPELVGLSAHLPGALTERFVLDAHRLLVVPDHVPDEAATLAEPLAVGLHAVARAAPVDGEAALVAGCGPVGLTVVAALVAAGCGPVVASDPSAVRRRAAEALGADVVVDPRETSPFDHVRGLARPERPPSPLLAPGEGPRTAVAFECVGRADLTAELVAGCPRHTDVVVVGVCLQPDTLHPVVAVEREASVSYVFAYRPEELATALERLAAGRVDVDALVSRLVDLDELPGALEDLRAGREVKVLVRPTSPGRDRPQSTRH